MKSTTMRFIQVLFVALFMVVGAVGPAYAQSSPPAEFGKVSVQTESGWRAMGRHSIADDFVLVCPIEEVLEDHPCSETNANFIGRADFQDFVLVCPLPGKHLPDANHPCNQRSAQIKNARPQDFVLVCPLPGYDLPGNHPCNQSASIGRFEVPNDYVLTCPVKEVLEQGHPCAERNRSR